VSGTLTSNAVFAPETYQLAFDIGSNSSPSGTNTVTVSLDGYSETYSRTGAVPLTMILRTVTVAATLIFATTTSETDNAGIIRRVGARRVTLRHVSRLPPPNRTCNFHCIRLSIRRSCPNVSVRWCQHFADIHGNNSPVLASYYRDDVAPGRSPSIFPQSPACPAPSWRSG
jgi:hypothetical protein